MVGTELYDIVAAVAAKEQQQYKDHFLDDKLRRPTDINSGTQRYNSLKARQIGPFVKCSC